MEKELAKTAEQIVSMCLTLDELPFIRFANGQVEAKHHFA